MDMDKRQLFIITGSLVAVWLLITGTLAASPNGFDLGWHIITSGGGQSASTDYVIGSSIGQPVVGGLSGGSYRLEAGFWPGIGVEAPTPTSTPTPTPTGTVGPTPTPTPTSTVAPGAQLVVNVTDDTDDGSCDASHCSLREATRLARSGDTIAFDIPPTDPGYNASLGVWTIRPQTSYGLAASVTLDGTTQTTNRGDTNPQGPEIEVDGSSHAGGYSCFRLRSNDILRGLVINRCGAYGLWVEGSGIVVAGNYIGTDPTGTQARPVAYDGILVIRAQNNTIGGSIATDRNVISGNNSNGIRIADATSQGNQIVGNYIGTDRTGTSALGNAKRGITIHDDAHDNTIGPGNIIAFNTGDGVLVVSSGSLRNKITGNSIHSNGGLGINNTDGGNLELAPPVITAASTTQVSGTACSGCTVEVFSDDDGEGRIFEGSTVADGSGNWSFNVSLTGPNITATGTDTAGNTSEFSTPVSLVQVTPTPTATPTGTVPPTPTPTVTGTPPVPCDNVLPHGDFEAGLLPPWGTSGGTQVTTARAHGGARSVRLGGANNAADELFAGVELPSAATSITLSYWWYVESTDSTPGADVMVVVVGKEGQEVVVETLTNASPRDAWHQSTFDLASYAGQMVSITFHAETDGNDPTSFYVDDVEIRVCGAAPVGRIYLPIVLKSYP